MSGPTSIRAKCSANVWVRWFGHAAANRFLEQSVGVGAGQEFDGFVRVGVDVLEHGVLRDPDHIAGLLPLPTRRLGLDMGVIPIGNFDLHVPVEVVRVGSFDPQWHTSPEMWRRYPCGVHSQGVSVGLSSR